MGGQIIGQGVQHLVEYAGSAPDHRDRLPERFLDLVEQPDHADRHVRSVPKGSQAPLKLLSSLLLTFAHLTRDPHAAGHLRRHHVDDLGDDVAISIPVLGHGVKLPLGPRVAPSVLDAGHEPNRSSSRASGTPMNVITSRSTPAASTERRTG